MSHEFISVLSADFQKGGLWPVGDKGIGTIADICYITTPAGNVGAMIAQMRPDIAPIFQDAKYNVDKPTTFKVTVINPAEGGDPVGDICSAGDAARLVATPDGNGLVRAQGTMTTGLSESSNLAYFFLHLEKSVGFDTRPLGANIRILRGKTCEFLSVPQPERANMVKVNRPGQQTDPNKKGRILLIAKVDVSVTGTPQAQAAPGVTMAAPMTPAPMGGPGIATQPAAPANGEVDATVQEILLGAVAEKGTLLYKDLAGIVMTKLREKNTPAQAMSVMLRRAVDETFLAAGPWKYANKTLTLG